MTEHEFFELLAEVDEDLVIDAKAPADLYNDPFSDLPQKIQPVRRSPWKPLAATAACLAVIAVGLAVVLNIRGRQSELPLESNTNSNNITALAAAAKGYPAAAAYQYKGDFSELEIDPTGVCDFFIWEEDKKPSFTWADLIVVGTFVDDAYQTFDPESKNKHYLTYEDYSCNKLRIEKVIKGGAEVGDEIIICDRYGVSNGRLYYDDLTPMVKGDTWCYALRRDYDKGENCYSTYSLYSRYPVPGSVQPEFKYMKNNCGIAMYNDQDDWFQARFEQYKEYVGRMLNGDPEILKTFRFEYNGVTYYIEGSYTLPFGKLIVGMPRTEIKAGDNIEVLAVIDNTSDEPAAFEEVYIRLNRNGCGLHEVLDVNTGGTVSYDDAESSHIIQPGETYYQLMKFDTNKQYYKPEDTVIPDYVTLGKYDGTASIRLLKDPDDLSRESIAINNVLFNVNITDSRTDVEFNMDEFPGVSFKCGRTDLIAKAGGSDTALFSDVPIKNLYLIDLNGDGKRELCSTISVGSGSVDDRILAFDYANGKLYELSDRLNCDYHIEVGSDPITGEWYVNAGRYDYLHGILISSTPLSLDIMTEVKSITTFSDPKIVTAKLSGSEPECEKCEFRMAEFPGVEFYCRDNDLYANGESLNPIKCNYDALYVSDLNGDGKREILAVCRGNTEHIWVFIFDYANSASYNIGLDGNDNCSLDFYGDDIYLVTNGRRSEGRLKIAATGMETIRDDKTGRKSFKIPEISDSDEFIVDDSNISIKRENGETEIVMSFYGNSLTKVYLCDLNGDGRREIAAEGGPAEESPYIQVYDAAMSRNYQYNMANCTLEVGSGGLAVAVHRDDGSVLLSKKLTLDIMRLTVNSGKMKYWSFPEAKTIYDESVHTERFTVPEYDGYEFVIEDGDITMYRDGSESGKLFGSDEVKKVYLYDTECDMEEEIYAVVKRKGENKTVVCVAYKDRSGDIRTSFTESINVGYDMDLIVSDIRTLLYKDAALA